MKSPPDSPEPRKTAVALQYELGGNRLPRVVASGRGTLAEKMLEIAFANNIRVREDRGLAELLAKVEIDSDIPTEALIAVAEILSYLYRANGQIEGGRIMGGDKDGGGRQGQGSGPSRGGGPA